MKKALYSAMALAMCATMTGGVAFADAGAQAGELATQASQVPVYRLYTGTTGEHLYTTDANEARTLSNGGGWNYEGTSWYAPDSGKAVYRLNNDLLQNHLYTTDANEMNVLTTVHGWTVDNGGQPLFYSGGTVGVYRLYNEELNGMHHLTTDLTEYNALPQYGWEKENVALYAVNVGNPSDPIGAEGAPAPATPVEPDKTPIGQPAIVGSSDISNVDSWYSIEADVKLSGVGTGYHAKLVACTPMSAVSFGLQFDNHAEAPYTGQTAFLFENVGSNDPGQQKYQRAGVADINRTYRLLLTMDRSGVAKGYVDGQYVGQVTNTAMASQLASGQRMYVRVEGSARVNGDAVNAQFANIKLKGRGEYPDSKSWGTARFDTNAGVHSDLSRFGSRAVTISGTVQGLADGEDWDNAYDRVSGVTQFTEPGV